MQIITFSMVFVSLSALCFLLCRTVFLDLGRPNAKNIAADASRLPVEHFVSLAKLKKMKISFSLVASLVMLCLLIYIHVDSVIAGLVAVAVAGAAAFQAPQLYFNRKVDLRNREFRGQLLDLILGLNNGLRSGVALPQALELVGRDIGGTMQEEIAVTLYEYRLGIELTEALNRLEKRMPDENLKLLVTAIGLSQKSGGSLSDILERLIETIRQRSAFQDKIDTLTAQGKFESIVMAAAPLMAFLILYFLDTKLMTPLVTTVQGWCAILVIGLLEGIGYLFIRKIVSVEI